ncbi:MAG TPA: hypothetical protein DIU00_07260 [Phycisphaerales bacterium]|nr:hypothetical protein [Phycisphaerales bacterium]
MWELVEQNAGTFITSSISTFAGIIVGGFITWLVSHHHYQKASIELRTETEKSRKLIKLILCVLEKKGWAKLQRDKNGNIVGFSLLEIAVHDNVTVRDATAVKVVNKKDK